MEIIEIRIEYPSGMSITDRASYLADAGHVYPSERLGRASRILYQRSTAGRIRCH